MLSQSKYLYLLMFRFASYKKISMLEYHVLETLVEKTLEDSK